MVAMSSKQSVLRFKYDNFINISSRECTSAQTDNHGNFWSLQMKPKHRESFDPNNVLNVGLFLVNRGKEAASVKFSIILRDADGQVHMEQGDEKKILPAPFSWGFPSFIERSVVLDKKNNILLDGALHVDVHIEQISSSDDLTNRPSTPLANKILKLLENKEGADVSFKIGDAIIPAHRFMLRVNAPVLFEFCEGKDVDSPIPINGVTPEVFHTILRYIYSEELPEEEIIKSNGKKILDAANRFFLTDLKISIETALVRHLFISIGDAAEWLLFADSKTCALLKEYTMSFIVARSEDLLNYEEFSRQLGDSPKLLIEVMKEISKNLSNDQRFGGGKNASVNELRKILRGKGLDVDGTKEMLISRLNDSNKRQKVAIGNS